MGDELLYKIALTFLPNIGPVSARQLVSYCGGAEQVFRSSRSELLKIPGIGEKTAAALKDQAEPLQAAEEQMLLLEKSGGRALFYLDPGYPYRLRPYKDAPVVLYFIGNGDLQALKTVGVVGTRKPTESGRQTTAQILEELAPLGIQVISGLAYGIDITAHRQCLQLGLPTIGVLGSGLGHVYPQQHSRTAWLMQESGGLITEFPFMAKPDAANFPMRNRIIAALSDALVVIESAQQGGSMITADLANGYDKEVFAVPGKPGDLYSKGCNALIKTQRAQLVENGEEIAEYMGWTSAYQQKSHVEVLPELTGLEQQISAILTPDTETSIDKIYKLLNLPPSDIAASLLNLEFKGVVRMLPGKRYILAN